MAVRKCVDKLSDSIKDLPEDLMRPASLLKKTGALMLNFGVRSFSIRVVKLPLKTSVNMRPCNTNFPLSARHSMCHLGYYFFI